MFRRFFAAYNNKTIASAAVVVGAMSLASRVLGLLRDRVLAGEFGAGAELDSYYAAFRLPDLIYNLLVVGALSAGFIPVFTAVFSRERDAMHGESWRLVNNALNVIGLSAIVVSAVMAIWSVPLMRLFAPGFPSAQLSQTAALMRIMLLSPVLLGASAVLSGVLQSLKRFFIFSLSPILYNVGIICGALFLVPKYGITGLAWGVVLGAFLHFLIQVPAVAVIGFRYRWVMNFRNSDFRQMMRLMWPRTISLAVNQVNLVVVTVLASLLSAGSLTAFNFANNLQSLPLGIFGISFAIAAFPTLSELASRRERFISTFSQTLRQVLFLVVPSSALLILLRAQIVRVLLGSGRFDWPDTVATMETLAVFSISLFAQALIPLIIRAYYALQDSVTPLLTALGAALSNVVLAIILTPPLGVVGLALAVTIANVAQLAVLWLLLHVRLGNLDEAGVLASTVKIAVASTGMALVAQGVKYVAAPVTGTETFLGIALQGGLSACAGLATYVIISLILQSPEAIALLDSLRGRHKPVTVTEVVGDSTPT
ncbi:MAG: murein biosynthesis integral membrane protein MurJ [Patescibacteria group bacterium]|nr:murein biosynthesis integral membrane protein MurJ [Patescibacteria group bacterium]